MYELGVLTPTLHKQNVPLLFREPHVETGFRALHQPWRYYLYSVFQKHNECMNTWTHFIALVIMLARLFTLSHDFDFLHDVYTWPLLAGMASMIILYMCSTCAHCLQNKSETIHYTCFMVDYAGIGLYGFGSALVHFTYCSTDSFYEFVEPFYLPVAVALAVNICFCCSISKTRYSRPYPFTRKVWQLGSVIAMYVWLILPVVHLLIHDAWYGDRAQSLPHHLSQMFWFALAGFFFGSDIPQRFYPGMFDFIGHSHQIFHVCILMTSYKQLDGIVLDMIEYKDDLHSREAPTFMSTFGSVGIVLLANLCLVVGFRYYVSTKLLSNNTYNNNIEKPCNGVLSMGNTKEKSK